MSLLLKAGERCRVLLETKIQNVPVDDIQVDEIWTFVGKKESRRVWGDKDFQSTGDAWTYIGIERNTKLVLAYHLDRRTRWQRRSSWLNSRKLLIRLSTSN